MGEALNFDGDDAGPLGEFFIANGGYWIDEFHLDGLRLDATQQIFDRSAEERYDRTLDAGARGGRCEGPPILCAENEPQHVKLVRALAQGGNGLDMFWNDDYHHSAMTVLTGHNEAYYTDYLGARQDLPRGEVGLSVSGGRPQMAEARRGTPSTASIPAAFVNFLQNHDQVANSGDRQSLSPADVSRLYLARLPR